MLPRLSKFFAEPAIRNTIIAGGKVTGIAFCKEIGKRAANKFWNAIESANKINDANSSSNKPPAPNKSSLRK